MVTFPLDRVLADLPIDPKDFPCQRWYSLLVFCRFSAYLYFKGRRKKEEGRRKKEEGRGKKEEGRRKKEEARRKKEEARREKEEGRRKKESSLIPNP
jgi:hypothetical protein